MLLASPETSTRAGGLLFPKPTAPALNRFAILLRAFFMIAEVSRFVRWLS